jgi:NAD(P)-dependent dehydrogenase (short-subunit alcohol dehydrogenase family)
MRGLRDKAVLVTGGSSGIGLATVRRFLDEGSRVFTCALDDDELRDALTPLGAGDRLGSVACDLRSTAVAADMVRRADAWLGGIDVLANNAGIALHEPFLEISTDDWDRVIEVNLRAVFVVAQAVAQGMVAAERSGVIVNMASTNALGGEAGFAHYNASKGGVLQLTRTMAVELGARGIRVNCVCPGFVETDMWTAVAREQGKLMGMTADEFTRRRAGTVPLGRMERAEDVANVIGFLVSEKSGYMTGQALSVDGGLVMH